MRAVSAWVAFVERRHRHILLASGAVTLVAALSLLWLRFDFDVLRMLPSGAPAFDNFKAFVGDFGELDELAVLITGPDPAALQSFADAFVTRVRRLDTVTSVQGRIDAEEVQAGLLGAYLYNYVPADAYPGLRARLTPQAIDAQVAADRAILQAPLDLSSAAWIRRDPLGIGRIAADALRAQFGDAALNLRGGYVSSQDGRALLVLVRPAQNAFDIAFTTRFLSQVRAAETDARSAAGAAPAVRVGYTGSYAFALEDAGTFKWDIGRYTVLALIGVLAVFTLGYRNLRILPFVTYPLVLSTLLTFAASLALYAQLDAVSISFAAILYGLSIDSGIQFYTRLLQELQHGSLRDALTRTLVNLGTANVVACGTTAAAFFVIGFSGIAGVSQLGFLTAIGMLVTIGEFFVLYPALSFRMPQASLAHGTLDAPRLGRLARAAVRHARGVTAAVCGLGVALLLLAGRVAFDVDLTHLRPAHSAAARVQDQIAAQFAETAAAGAVLVRAPALDDALRETEQVSAALQAYRGRGLLRGLQSVTALLPSARTQRERLALFDRLPRTQAARDLRAALQRHGFVVDQFDGFLRDFEHPRNAILRLGDPVLQPFAALLARHVRRRGDRFTVATYVEPAAGVSLADVAARLHRDLPGVPFVVAGRPLLEDELGRRLRRDLAGFCVASFALNLLLLLGVFRPLGTAAAIVLPEALVIVCLLALMRAAGIGIDPVNLIVVPIILGIGVDNCVYVAERHRRGEDFEAAVRHGGRALGVSALTTMTGFGFLALSRDPALARMGALAAVSLFLCFVAAITFLPALLTVVERGGGWRARVAPRRWMARGRPQRQGADDAGQQ